MFYTLAEDSTNATHRMDKSEILIIKYEDGRTMTMKDAGAAVSAPAAVNPAAKSVSEEAVKQNETMIRNHNLRSLVYEGTKRKGKEASTMFLALGVKPSSALYDGNLSVRLVPGYFSARDEKFVPYSEVEYFSVMAFSPYFVTELENHTDKTLYKILRLNRVRCPIDPLPIFATGLHSDNFHPVLFIFPKSPQLHILRRRITLRIQRYHSNQRLASIRPAILPRSIFFFLSDIRQPVIPALPDQHLKTVVIFELCPDLLLFFFRQQI